MTLYNTLYYHPHIGYIIQYTESRKIQMGYAILKINFFEDEFASFRRCLQSLSVQYAALKDNSLKEINIPTPDPGMEIVLSLRQLLQLQEMVETADSEIKALDLMTACNSPRR